MSAQSEYGRGAVYGSLAYDTPYPEAGSEPEETEAVEQQPRHLAVSRAGQGIAPFSIIGILIAAFLFVTAMTARTRLLDLSTESAALQEEIAELETEQARLRIAYETSFNLADVESYATRVLGMQKPLEDQITYLDIAAPDRAVVVQEKNRDGFVDRVSDFLVGLGAYFAWSAE